MTTRTNAFAPAFRRPGSLLAVAVLLAAAALLACTAPGASAAPARADDTLRPFDGRTLDGWEGDRGTWTVEDGAIVGRSTAARPLAQLP